MGGECECVRLNVVCLSLCRTVVLFVNVCGAAVAERACV